MIVRTGGTGRSALKSVPARLERQFLPAVLEIQETPPSPAGRALLWSIMMFLVLAAIWATVSEIDIVTVARGKVVPAGKSKVIQPLETGRIVAINVEEGQRVSEGNLLVELDRTDAHADVERLTAARDDALNEVNRFDHLSRWLRDNGPRHADETLVEDFLLVTLWREHQSRLDTLLARRREIESRSETARAQMEKIEALVPIVEKRAANERSLLAKKMFPEQEYLQTEQLRVGMVHDLEIERSRVAELIESVREVDAEIQHAGNEFQRSVYARREEARRMLVSAEQELLKTKQREAARSLSAPVDGVVHQLAVHTVGGVVTPAQTLMIIVPVDADLEVEALGKL